MSSWWGPTWISVRCRGKSEWTSSPVGSAPTQRRAQMRPPTPATPKEPCQVKKTPSDPQIDRQAASMPAIMHGQSGARQGNQRFSLPTWFDPVRNITIQSFNFGLQSPCSLAPSWHLFHLSSRHLPREEHWHQLPHLQLMIGGRLFQVPVSVCPLSIPLEGSDLEAACRCV